MGRILSIDYGLARLGLALSDERKIIASSLPTLPAKKTVLLTVEALLTQIAHLDLEQIVVGHPLRLNGKNSFFTDEVLYFVSVLKEKTSIPVILWDERLTTLQAERSLREANLSRKKRSQKIDGVAATLILQNYLESLTGVTYN